MWLPIVLALGVLLLATLVVMFFDRQGGPIAPPDGHAAGLREEIEDLLSLPVELPRVAGVHGNDFPPTSDSDVLWRSLALLDDGMVLGAAREGAARPSWKFSSTDPYVEDEVVQRIVEHLAGVTSQPGAHSPNGRSRVCLLIYADRRVKWGFVQWILRACEDPKVSISGVSFVVQGATRGIFGLDCQLTASSDLAPGQPDRGGDQDALEIKLFRHNLSVAEEAFTRIRVDAVDHAFDLPGGWKGRSSETLARARARDALLGSVFEAVQARSRDRLHGAGPSVASIVAPPPRGGHVPHGDVMEVLGILRGAGVADVRFAGIVLPLTVKEGGARPGTVHRPDGG